MKKSVFLLFLLLSFSSALPMYPDGLEDFKNEVEQEEDEPAELSMSHFQLSVFLQAFPASL
ncbi:MAG: hypothetical protein JXR86_07790 [Spirochaetales bacterium]|nr:hypothetical protein [Spirochaetales bacterium]